MKQMQMLQLRPAKKGAPTNLFISGFWKSIVRPVLGACLLTACLLHAAQAQSAAWPAKTIKIIVPYPAGSSPDLMGRMLAQSFQATFRQTVVVENKAGAFATIGTQEVARSAPDGYTLLLTTNTPQAANVALVKDLPYDPIKDFSAISSTAKLRSAGKLNIVDVPYKGIPLAVNDMLGGQLAFTFADLPLALPLLRSGRARGLGVTSLQRVAADPQIPALAETFPGFEVTGWQGLVAPAGTPDAVIDKLHDAVKKALAEPQNVERMKSLSFTPSSFTPKQFSGFIVQEVAKWKEDAKQAGMTPQ